MTDLFTIRFGTGCASFVIYNSLNFSLTSYLDFKDTYLSCLFCYQLNLLPLNFLLTFTFSFPCYNIYINNPFPFWNIQCAYIILPCLVLHVSLYFNPCWQTDRLHPKFIIHSYDILIIKQYYLIYPVAVR